MMFVLRASAGLVVWSAGFSLLYALHGLGCALGWPHRALLGWTLFGWALALAWTVFLLAGTGLVVWSLRLPPPDPFERRLTQVSAITGLVALLVSGAPILVVSACI